MEKAQKRLGREILIGYAVMALMIVVGELIDRGVLLTAAALRFGLKAYCRRKY